MKEILQNLALINLCEFATKHKIDISGSHVVKNGRGYNYSLVKDETGRAILSVCFHKSSTPTYIIHDNN